MSNPNGAFTLTPNNYSSSISGGTIDGWGKYSINSSRSSSIYQSGGTIRPVSRQVRFYNKILASKPGYPTPAGELICVPLLTQVQNISCGQEPGMV